MAPSATAASLPAKALGARLVVVTVTLTESGTEAWVIASGVPMRTTSWKTRVEVPGRFEGAVKVGPATEESLSETAGPLT